MTGFAPLNSIHTSVGGIGASNFNITQPSESLAPGQSSTFSMSFAPFSAGVSVAALRIQSNVPTLTDINFVVSGEGFATTQATWRQQHFGSGLNTGDAADMADPDQDGTCNLLEYAGGSLPTSASKPYQGTAHSLVNGGMDFTFDRLSSRTDITYTVQSSFDMLNWLSSARSEAGQLTRPLGSDVESVTDFGGETSSVTVRFAPSNTGQRFVRIQVSKLDAN